MLIWVSASVVRALDDIARELQGIREVQERIAVALEATPPRIPSAVRWTVGQPQEERNA